jgi:hypothetical protein
MQQSFFSSKLDILLYPIVKLDMRNWITFIIVIGQFMLDIFMQSVTTRQQASHTKLAGACG